ncbi:MAG: hypothetical protein ACK5O1_01225 [Holosporales bacterium]|jgi:hypothetical protein
MSLYNFQNKEHLTDLMALKTYLGTDNSLILNFNFMVNGAAYQAQVNAQTDPAILLLLAEFGHLPFTAESKNRREEAMQVIEYAKNFLNKKDLRLGISKTQSLFLLGRAEIAKPYDVKDVLNACGDLLSRAHVPLALLRQHIPHVFLRK